jgi:hypothetical protein
VLASEFYTGGHVGCYVGGLSKLYHKFVTDIWKMSSKLWSQGIIQQ